MEVTLKKALLFSYGPHSHELIKLTLIKSIYIFEILTTLNKAL